MYELRSSRMTRDGLVVLGADWNVYDAWDPCPELRMPSFRE